MNHEDWFRIGVAATERFGIPNCGVDIREIPAGTFDMKIPIPTRDITDYLKSSNEKFNPYRMYFPRFETETIQLVEFVIAPSMKSLWMGYSHKENLLVYWIPGEAGL